MSKAFTKEETADAPAVVPSRAPLPAGVPNYVTARGLGLLRAELARLEAERTRLESDEVDDAERKHHLAIVVGRITELAGRVTSATLVDPSTHPPDEVRFGANVTVRGDSGVDRRYQIVGVDEADAAHGRVAFVAPIARALLGRTVGELTSVRTARGEEPLEITAIDYDAD
jgi:transcription elongation factor GreB